MVLDISLDAGIKQWTTCRFVLNGQYNDVSAGLSVDGVSYTFQQLITSQLLLVTTQTMVLCLQLHVLMADHQASDGGNVNAGITNGGFYVGAAYDFENGWTAALGYAGPETNIMSKEGTDAYGANVAYTADVLRCFSNLRYYQF